MMDIEDDWTWTDFWYAARYGGVYCCWQMPMIFGRQVAYYDGWHFAIHFGFFSVEVS